MKKNTTKKNLIPAVHSLSELYLLAKTDERYMKLLMAAAHNLGGGHCKDFASAKQWLDTNALETDEEGVVEEVNFCRDLI